jgi:hypothetical protein
MSTPYQRHQKYNPGQSAQEKGGCADDRQGPWHIVVKDNLVEAQDRPKHHEAAERYAEGQFRDR